MWILRHHTNKIANIQLMQTKMLHWSAGGEELKQNKYERVTDKQNWNAGEKLRTQQKEEINKEMCLCCNKFVKTDVKFGQCGNWFHYICDGTTEEQVKKKKPRVHVIHIPKRPYKILTYRNINRQIQDKMILELREKLILSEIMQKEIEV